MPSKDTKLLELNQFQKPDKALFISYAYLECLMEKIGVCRNNPENLYTTNGSEHVQVFQCLQYDQYQHRKLAGYIERETLHKKGLWIFKGARNEDN